MGVRQQFLGGARAVGARLRALLGPPSSPWVPVGFYVPVALAFVLWNLLGEPSPLWAWLALPAAGLFLWTLLEYVLHAGLFHHPSLPPWLRPLLSDPHGSHHDAPDDPGQLVARLTFSFPVAVLLYGALALVFWSPRLAGLVMVGVVVGYLGYEVIHYAIHFSPRARRLIRPLASHHLHHHYADPSRCFGVSTRLWDWVFRTGRRRRGHAAEPEPSAPTPPSTAGGK
jgi:sterol desaturase/sphingolipid hydroxylase (fatty acid hydroxylase superfamily)